MKTKTIKINTTIKTIEIFYPKYFIAQAFIMFLGSTGVVSLNALFIITLVNVMYLAIDFILDERSTTVSIKNDTPGRKNDG